MAIWRYSPKRLVALLGIGVSAGFIYLAFSRLEWREVAARLGQAELWPWLPLAVVSYLAGHLVRGMRCRLLVSHEANLALTTASTIVAVGYAVNNLLPARMGELARSGMLSDRAGLPLAQSLTVTFLERIFDGVVIVLIFLTVAWTSPLPAWVTVSVRVAALVFGTSLLLVLVAVVSPERIVNMVSQLAERLGGRLHALLVRLTGQVLYGVAYLRRAGDALRILLLSIAVWLLETGLFLFLLPALGLRLDPRWALLAMAITNLGILVPSTPGFIGPFHFFCMQTLVVLGVADAPALSYAILVHIAFFVPITVWGAGAIAWYGLDFGTTFANARAARHALGETSEHGVPVRLITTYPELASATGPSPFLRALVAALIPEGPMPSGEEEREAVAGRVAEFVHGQITSMRGILRFLLGVGMTVFRALVFVRYRRGFLGLPVDRRRAVAEWWAYGPLAVGRQLFRALRSTALLAFFEDPAIAGGGRLKGESERETA